MITKAIIPVAGWGSRRLPITKAIDKSMLPIGNRPLVDYVVQDCIKAGITDIYFVVGEDASQLQQYYGRNQKLEDYLERVGKDDYIQMVAPIEGVNFHYTVQPADGGYGTAVPVALVVQEFNINEPVVVVMGDDFIFNKDDSSEIARLLKAANGGAAMLGVSVNPNQVSRYGVIEKDTDNNFVQIVEKPSVDEAPSDLINVSKYVMTPALLELIVKYTQTDRNDEYYITDPINEYVKSGGKIKVAAARGEYLDGGSLEGWLHANRVVHADL